jgi:hypothetical protein
MSGTEGIRTQAHRNTIEKHAMQQQYILAKGAVQKEKKTTVKTSLSGACQLTCMEVDQILLPRHLQHTTERVWDVLVGDKQVPESDGDGAMPPVGATTRTEQHKYDDKENTLLHAATNTHHRH